MSYYFIVNIYLKEKSKPEEYKDYIDLVKPIVEKYGGEYLVRTDEITYLTDDYTPDRIITVSYTHLTGIVNISRIEFNIVITPTYKSPP